MLLDHVREEVIREFIIIGFSRKENTDMNKAMRSYLEMLQICVIFEVFVSN